MASPVKLAPATDVWVNAWVFGTPSQAEIEPFRLAKMNAADSSLPPFPNGKARIVQSDELEAFAAQGCDGRIGEGRKETAE
jgi:hypothetical protein